MQARLVQIVSRYIGVALMLVAGFLFGDEVAGENAETIANFGNAIALACVGFATLMVDLFLHRLATGGIMKPAGASK